MEELAHAALDEGVAAFVPKPLDVEALIRLIGEIKETGILIVEEDAGTAEALSSALKEQGYRVTATDSPETALELAGQIRFDIVFIASELPLHEGTGTSTWRSKRITPAVVAIMIAGARAALGGIGAGGGAPHRLRLRDETAEPGSHPGAVAADHGPAGRGQLAQAAGACCQGRQPSGVARHSWRPLPD